MIFKHKLRWKAWCVSLTLHALIVCFLACTLFRPESLEAPVPLQTSFSNPVAPSEPFTPDIPVEQLFLQPDEKLRVQAFENFWAAVPLGSDLPHSLTVGNAAGGAGIGLGGDGTLPGENTIGFFGTRAAAQSVIFIVDMSGSMEGNRFPRAQQELSRAVHQLHVTQKFYIFFFNAKTIPLYYPAPSKELVAATPMIKRKTTRWIYERKPVGGTDPADALRRALEMRPDVIFFLTDGDFAPECRDIARQLNQHGTVIHTLALQNRDGVALLSGIAEDHKGTFRFVK